MAPGSKICPECGSLNSRDSDRCARCDVRFDGPVKETLLGLWEAALGRETPVTRLLALLCVLTFGIAITSGGDLLQFGGGFSPSQALRGGALTLPAVELEPWRVLSAMFVHFGALHFAFNMLGLADLGRVTEPHFGSARYTFLLLGGVVAGFALSWLYFSWTETRAITGGISGGLFSLMGAEIGSRFARRDPEWRRMLFRLVIYSVLFALMLPMNNAAHAGGFAFGAIMGYLFQKESRPWRLAPVFRAVAFVLVALSVWAPFLANGSDLWRVERAREIQNQGFRLDPDSLR